MINKTVRAVAGVQGVGLTGARSWQWAGAALADEFLAVGQSSLGSGPSEDGAQSLPHVCSDVAAGLRDAYASGTSEALWSAASAFGRSVSA